MSDHKYRQQFDKLAKEFGILVADAMTSFFGTWKFIFVYSVGMLAWYFFHKYGILNIDSADFAGIKFWMTFLAGIQASILLISSGRQEDKDRAKADQTLKIAQRNLKHIDNISRQLDALDNFINMIEAEHAAKKQEVDDDEFGRS